jgi:hypothetical protein
MSLLPPKPTQVFFIVDESGSMGSFTSSIREAVSSIIETNLDPSTRFQVIAFSEDVDSAPTVAGLKKPMHSGTRIAPAFRKMHALLRDIPAKRQPERVVIAFISDGQDDSPSKCLTDLKALPALQYDSILLTIGIGMSFPTGLVVDALRPRYHKGPSALPPVLPVSAPSDLGWAFGQLEAVLLTELMQHAPIPSKADDTVSTRGLIQFIRARYNECVIKCAESGRKPRDNLGLLNDTTARMHEVVHLARARVVQERASKTAWRVNPEGEKVEGERIKPLLSNLISATIYNPKTCLTLALSIVRRLNDMIAAASKGQLISDLPDAAKKELIGYAYTEGRLIQMASRYRSANFSTTKQSLLRLLRAYSPKETDKLLPDPINLADQAEYFVDARDNLLDLIPFTHTLPGILKVLPFVGRTLTLREPLPVDALQMNEWLAEVVALPMVHRHMTTYDFYETFQGSFSAREERVNGLMVLGGDQLSPGIFHHVQSMLLLKHPALFVLTARLAVAASVLTFILGSHSTHEGWMDLELETVRSVCANYPQTSLGDWHLYMDDIRSKENHLRCLVAESPKLPRHCRCPGLTKYLLALYLAIEGGHPFTQEDLRERHMALVTEFMARCKLQFFDFFHSPAVLSPQGLLEDAWEEKDEDGNMFGDRLLGSCTTYLQARALFTARVDQALRTSSRSKVLVGTTFRPNKLYDLTHYQLSLQRIGNALANLAHMCPGLRGEDSAPGFILGKDELVRALYTVQTVRTAYERSQSPAPTDPIPKEALQGILASHFAGRQRNAVLGLLDTFVKARYEEAHQQTHQALARPLPSGYIERFREEFDLDIGNDWAVGASGLSTIACCSPNCPHYLELLERPLRGTGLPEPVVCRKLRLHLAQGGRPLIQGFHRTVSACQNLSPELVAAMIASGEMLREPFPTKDDMLFRSILLHKGGGESALEALRSKQAVERREAMLSGLQHAVTELSGGDPSYLAQTVSTLQGQMASPPWLYEDFRALFVAKYKKCPGLTRGLEKWQE